jgi:hypothetical protein
LFDKASETDKSILQSFVTFIAFDRLLTLANQLEFKPSKLLDKIFLSMIDTLENDKTKDKTQ